MKPNFKPGKNIAIKVPFHHFEQTVSFYRDLLGLEQIHRTSPDADDSVTFRFGDKNLWIDRSATLSQAEIWLEVQTADGRLMTTIVGALDQHRSQLYGEKVRRAMESAKEQGLPVRSKLPFGSSRAIIRFG